MLDVTHHGSLLKSRPCANAVAGQQTQQEIQGRKLTKLAPTLKGFITNPWPGRFQWLQLELSVWSCFLTAWITEEGYMRGLQENVTQGLPEN